ncbi:MAG: hypothetical protein ACE5EK_02865 [Nitrospinales bacterium]
MGKNVLLKKLIREAFGWAIGFQLATGFVVLGLLATGYLLVGLSAFSEFVVDGAESERLLVVILTIISLTFFPMGILSILSLTYCYMLISLVRKWIRERRIYYPLSTKLSGWVQSGEGMEDISPVEKEQLLKKAIRWYPALAFASLLAIGITLWGKLALDIFWFSLLPKEFFPLIIFLWVNSIICLYALISLVRKWIQERRIYYPLSTQPSGWIHSAAGVEDIGQMEKEPLLEKATRWGFRLFLVSLLAGGVVIWAFITYFLMYWISGAQF